MRSRLVAFAAACVFVLCCPRQAVALLGLGSANPNQGTTAGGTTVDITSLDAITGTILGVEFDQTAATNVQLVGLFTIRATAPAHAAGAVSIKVRVRIIVLGAPVDQLLTMTNGFTYVAPPTVSGVSPASGNVGGGAALTITGTNFRSGGPGGGLPGGMQVSIGGAAATNLVIVNPTTMTALAPAHAAGAVNVVVTNGEGEAATLTNGFTYQAGTSTPTITSVAPPTGLASGGTSILVTGTGFVPGATVTVGGVAATSVTVGAGGLTLTATTPAHTPGAATVVVTNPDSGSATAAGAFTYIPLPTITGVLPTVGPISGGTAIGISGTGFQAGATATLCGQPLVLTSVTPTLLATVTPPCASGAASLVVTNPDGGSATGNAAFTFQASSTPTVQLVAPTSGPVTGGTLVTITGTQFAAGATVTIGCGPATAVTVLTPLTILATSPACAAGAANVTVTNTDGGTVTLGGAFTFNNVVSSPTLTAVTPDHGPATGGTPIQLAGSNFALGAVVRVGGTPALATVVLTPSLITAVTPPGAVGSASVSVTNPDTGSSTLPAGFTYSAPPVILSVLPSSVATSGGALVVISGSGFQVGATVNICGLPTVITSLLAIEIITITPPCVAGTADVVVTNPDGGTVTASLTVTTSSAPTIASVTPSSGAATGGTSITIAGTDFQVGATVIVGCDPATGVVVNPTSITAVTPACAAGAADVTVTNTDGGTVTLGGGFVFTAGGGPSSPTLTGIAPASGPDAGGTAVTVSGTGFANGAVLTIDGAAATSVVVVNTTTITAVTPAGTIGAADVVVVNADTGSATLPSGFTYSETPSVTSVTPSTGPASGGTPITIAGSGFATGVTAQLCGVPLVLATASGTTLATTTPACPAGGAALVITNPDGGTITVPNAFTYAASSTPTVTSITPTSGPTTGGTSVTIGGTGFLAGATVTIGCAAATNVVVAATSITATTPACAAGSANVTVTNPDAGTDTLGGGFTYAVGGVVAPAITSVAPSSGPIAGGTGVTIGGSNFANGVVVTFGGTAAAGVTVVSSSLLTATTPAHAAGAVAVVVTNPDSGTSTLPNGFTYVAAAAPTVTGITPGSGPIAGGTAFALTGTGFAPGMTVTLGGAAVVDLQTPSPTTATGHTPAHTAGTVDVVVTTAGGTTTLTGGFTYQSGSGGGPGDQDGDGLPDTCETQFGLDPQSGVGADGAAGDPDGDGRTNAQECSEGTHPRGFFRAYLAEGATGSFFDTTLELLNPGTVDAKALIRYQTETGTTPSQFLVVPAHTRRTVNPETTPGLEAAAFSTLVESDQRLVVERAMQWGPSHYGSSAETATSSPSTTWYFAEGATHGAFNLFYLLQNPGDTPATVDITYLRLAPKTPVTKQYVVAPHRRRTVWVDGEGPELAAEDLGARIQSDVPVVAERVMYMDSNGVMWNGGHAAMGVTAPQPRWFFAEGASGSFFHTFLLIANPNATPVTVRNTYFLFGGGSFTKDYTIAANARLTIGAHTDDPRLADTAFSTRVETLGGEGVVAERAMWWPTTGWVEGHDSMGIESSGLAWAFAGGVVGTSEHAETYVLVANENAQPAPIVVRAYKEDGTSVERTIVVPAQSRYNVAMSSFPELADTRFGVVVEATGATPQPVVVEGSVYGSADGAVWSSGSNAHATRLR